MCFLLNSLLVDFSPYTIQNIFKEDMSLFLITKILPVCDKGLR